MLKLAHAINPFWPSASSDISRAQPVTFETMRVSKAYAADTVGVRQVAISYPEDRGVVPEHIEHGPDLDRSVLDVARFTTPRKLPLLADILDRLYRAAPEADYLIYTNIDIALMPHFYCAVAEILATGKTGVVINRRTIPEDRCDQPMSLLYAEVGSPHPGFDCFVFRREAFPRFELSTVCIGAPYVGRVLLWNVGAFSTHFEVIRHAHLTFHLGDDQPWRSDRFVEYELHNQRAARWVSTQRGLRGLIEQDPLLRPYRLSERPPRRAGRLRTLARGLARAGRNLLSPLLKSSDDAACRSRPPK